MEVILSPSCADLRGSLGAGFGYHIEHIHGRYVSRRNSKGAIPKDGHLRFIRTCAVLSKLRLHIIDIRVTAKELKDALDEAGCWYDIQLVLTPKSEILNHTRVQELLAKYGIHF
jgi:hypothetical protein